VNATPGLRPDNTRSCRSSGPGLQQRTWHERLAGHRRHPYTLRGHNPSWEVNKRSVRQEISCLYGT
jgi:hypothetical protein